MAAMSRLLTSVGNEGCPCVNITDVLASLSGRICQLPNGDDGIRIDVDGSCAPFSYGSSQCLYHDMLHHLQCRIDDIGKRPDWCTKPWCYVDAASCARDSDERFFRTKMFPTDLGIFYSYSTCGSTADAWEAYKHNNVLEGKPINAVMPMYFPPNIYKRDPNSNDIITSGDKYYYNNSVPWEGVCVDYMRSLQEISKGDIGEISHTHTSKASSNQHKDSAFTAAAQDVANGFAHMAIGLYWITAERLRLTQFTVPVATDKVILVVPTKGLYETIGSQFLKVMMPFTPELWGVILATIVFAALLHVWLSDPLARGSSRSDGQSPQEQGQCNREKRSKAAYLRLFIDDFLEKAQEFAGGGVGFEGDASLAIKVLDFGFSFFVLVAVATYVANLAAFLTRSMIDESLTTMEGVVGANYKICAHPVIELELRKAWPKADFHFHKDKKEYRGMIDDYDAGKCQVLLLGWEDASMDEELLRRICDKNLAFTDSIVLEIPMGFPISSEQSKGISYWVFQGAKYHDASFQRAKENYLEKHPMDVCNVELSAVDSEESDYIKIETKNLALPLVFFGLSALVAAVLHLADMHFTKKNVSTVLARNSRVPLTMKSDANAVLEDQEEHEEAKGDESFYDSQTFYLDDCPSHTSASFSAANREEFLRRDRDSLHHTAIGQNEM